MERLNRGKSRDTLVNKTLRLAALYERKSNNSMKNPIHVRIERLRPFVEELLSAGGFAAEEAKAMAHTLVLSETMGHTSHGMFRVERSIYFLRKGGVVSNAKLEVVQETSSSITADAHCGVAPIVIPALLERMTAKLQTQAVVCAALANCGHIGRLGEWVDHAAHAGFAALLVATFNGPILYVAPPGGKQAVTGTNPLAFAFPLTENRIFSVDMSTCAIAFGKIGVAHQAKTQVPPGCLQDPEGHPTTDPAVIFSEPHGAILPMGGDQGYKGFALSMFIDLLVAGLSGGHAPPPTKDAKLNNSLTLTLWNPKFFAGLAHMQSEAEKYIDFVRACPLTDPQKPIRLPGDRSDARMRECAEQGVPLNEDVVQNLLRLARELNVMPPQELQAV